MARINIDVTEFGYNPKNTAQYNLTVLLGFDSLYYTIIEAAQNVASVLVLRSFHFDHNKNFSIEKALESTLLDDTQLKKPFKSTRIIIDTVHYTCIPSKFFDAQQKESYFKNLLSGEWGVERGEWRGESLVSLNAQPNCIFLSDEIRGGEWRVESGELRETRAPLSTPHSPLITVVYPIARTLHQKLVETFPTAQILNSVTTQAASYLNLVDSCQLTVDSRRMSHKLSTDNYQLSTKLLIANFRDGYMQIFFFESNQLIFSNNFKFAAPQDVIYYALLIYEQFKLNPLTVPLYIGGTITEDSDIYKFIFRYIKHVHFIEESGIRNQVSGRSLPDARQIPDSYLKLGNQFTGIPAHFYNDLFCGALY